MITSDGRDFYGTAETKPSQFKSPTSSKGVDYWKSVLVSGKLFKRYSGRILFDAEVSVPGIIYGWNTIKSFSNVNVTSARLNSDRTLVIAKIDLNFWGSHTLYEDAKWVLPLLDDVCSKGTVSTTVERKDKLPVIGYTTFRVILTATRVA